ncbi:hypothetical protein Fmac_000388 [Flemingia macrophylla]|uniref:Uncharacterized protein n=1 Tax=Flemingia macrophylla TaxID=520843 RepID=A0ABD1NES7_9FABA
MSYIMCNLRKPRRYGDVVIRYVNYKDPSLWFLLGFEVATSFPTLDYGIRRLDHTVRNMAELATAVSYLKGLS